MDVSRIEAVNPRQIEWRRLTAREIIKYDSEGIEVPDLYLQWAKNFLQDVYTADSDNTTFEMANSKTATPSAESASTSSENNDDIKPDEDKTPDGKPLSASEKHQQMVENNENLITMGEAFRSDSEQKTENSENGVAQVQSIENSSENEISSLESHMQNAISEAGNIKSKIANISKKNTTVENIAKIDELQKELKKVGVDAQQQLAHTDANLNQYRMIIGEQNIIGQDAVDYGNETIDIGREIRELANPYNSYNYIGLRVEMAGENALTSGSELENTANQANITNDTIINIVSDYKAEINNLTGVGEIVLNQGNGENQEDDSKNTTGTAAIQNTDKAASANLDQILQSKIRKGTYEQG